MKCYTRGCRMWFTKCPSCGNTRYCKRCARCALCHHEGVSIAETFETENGRKYRFVKRKPIKEDFVAFPFDKEFAYAKKLIHQVFQDYGVRHYPTVIRAKTNTACFLIERKTSQIVLGYVSCIHFAKGNVTQKRGGQIEYQQEYEQCKWLLTEPVFGLRAYHYLALHESAHGILNSREDYKAAHGPEFQKCLKELLEKYPLPKQ